MKSKIVTVLMTIAVFFLSSVFCFMGIILWNEYIEIKVLKQPENAKTIFYGNEETVEQNIKTPQIAENPFDKLKDVGQKTEEQEDAFPISVNQYFYQQLQEPSKIIYRAFEKNKENMKTGTYQVDLGNAFDDILKQSDGQDQLGEYYQSAIEAYTYDHPEVFYWSPNKMYLNIETITKGKNVTYHVYIDNGKEENYWIHEFSSKEQVQEALKQIEEKKNIILQNKTESVYDNIKMVHDYLIENVEYDTSISKDNIYNIYGALVKGEAVCEGYARSFKYMMDAMGIPCTLVIGKGNNREGQIENHAWNYVQMGEVWYAVDVTWDDPVTTTGWVSPSSKYRYFLKGTRDMVKDHTPSGQFTNGGKMFYYPTLSISNYGE